MIRNYILVICFFLITGCAGFEFVYNDDPAIDNIKNKTFFNVVGEEKDVVILYLNKRLGRPENEESKIYLLDITIAKKTKALGIEKNAVASNLEITHVIKYILKDYKTSCDILIQEFLTRSTYNTKSSGYNFGSDLSKESISKKNIETNIINFIDFIVSSDISFDCNDEA